ncbi:MAG: alpha/beta hydrolase [bacterium]
MIHFRKYGKAPFDVAVVHGGPGAWGEMAQVAKNLSSVHGVLEPLQTADSLQGQVEELRTVLQESSDLPVTLTGYSFGAWLSFLVAAHYPSLVGKLVLIASGPFEEKYVARLQETRLRRLSEEERREYQSLIRILEAPAAQDKGRFLARLGALAAKADAYDPVDDYDPVGACGPVMDESTESGAGGDIQGNIFQKVWEDAAQLRRSGNLLKLGTRIHCPVVAIHGDYDPHPAEGVRNPLAAILKDFRLILLRNCGHKPWLEQQAKDDFYRVLVQELPGFDSSQDWG